MGHFSSTPLGHMCPARHGMHAFGFVGLAWYPGLQTHSDPLALLVNSEDGQFWGASLPPGSILCQFVRLGSFLVNCYLDISMRMRLCRPAGLSQRNGTCR